ncbi:MAG: hypothetical protein IVZ94_02760, partial [Nitrospirae bacterium]|nr:hypothetical protein [Nitrospirota bacterium]
MLRLFMLIRHRDGF